MLHDRLIRQLLVKLERQLLVQSEEVCFVHYLMCPAGGISPKRTVLVSFVWRTYTFFPKIPQKLCHLAKNSKNYQIGNIFQAL